MNYHEATFVPGEFYHIYNRGNSKQRIFNNTKDYERFQKLLFLCNSKNSISFRDANRLKSGVYGVEQDEPLVSIGSYCLMSNHFHILLTPLTDDGVSQFIKKISTAYVMYFNKVNERTGGLFEGRFKSIRADSDRYLKYLFSYIHLNPLNIKNPRSDLGHTGNILGDEGILLERAIDYKYSSLSDYFDQVRDENIILNKESFPEYFSKTEDLRRELTDWIFFDEEQE